MRLYNWNSKRLMITILLMIIGNSTLFAEENNIFTQNNIPKLKKWCARGITGRIDSFGFIDDQPGVIKIEVTLNTVTDGEQGYIYYRIPIVKSMIKGKKYFIFYDFKVQGIASGQKVGTGPLLLAYPDKDSPKDISFCYFIQLGLIPRPSGSTF